MLSGGGLTGQKENKTFYRRGKKKMIEYSYDQMLNKYAWLHWMNHSMIDLPTMTLEEIYEELFEIAYAILEDEDSYN